MLHPKENSIDFEYKTIISELIKENLPLISKSIILTEKELDKLTLKDFKRYNEFSSNIDIHKSFKEKFHCILDLIFLSEIHEVANFLSYIDEQCYKFIQYVPDKLKQRAKTKIKEVVLTVDINLYDNNNPSFLNFFGEIIAINHILSSPDNRYVIEDIEYKLKNGKSIDFSIYDNVFKDFLLIEIMNIHFQKEKLLSYTPDEFLKFLKQRISDKYFDKTNLITNNIVIKILPIIWNNIEDITSFKSVIKNIDNGVYNFPVMFLLIQKDFEGINLYQFTSINSYFDSL